MLTNDHQDPTAATLRTADASAKADDLDPRTPIEVASAGTVTTNDPSGTDKRPPNGTAP